MDSLLIEQGFQNGDNIVRIGDKPFERFDPGTLLEGLVLEGARTVTVVRDGQEQTLTMPGDIAKRLTGQRKAKSQLVAPRFPFVTAQQLQRLPSFHVALSTGDYDGMFSAPAPPTVALPGD
jgi:regulator of sigma E protease